MTDNVMSIWKFPLSITDFQTVKMPPNSRVLTVQVQKRKLYVWAMVNLRNTTQIDYPFWIHGTGHPIEETQIQTVRYISTVSMDDGALMLHVFVGLDA
jgi:hypothetical protein